MTQDSVAYTWEINGRRTLNPDVFYETAQANGFNLDRQPLIQIDCPRGGHAGRATLLLSKDDAAAVVALSGPQKITVRKWIQTLNDEGVLKWNEDETYEFKDYYVLVSRDAFGVDENSKYVELADARYLLEQTFIRKRYNVRTATTDYDSSTLVTIGTPYTYQQVLNSLLSVLSSPPTLTIPVSYSPPENLIFDCTLAEALDQLLSSLGCTLTYDPLAGTYRVISLISATSLSVVAAAKSEGRLIEKTNVNAATATLPDKLNIRPAGIVVLEDKAIELPSRTFPNLVGSGIETINIDDHQLSPDLVRIPNAVNAWYGEQNFLLDETYQGILKQAPAEHLSNVRWCFELGLTKTRIQNRMPGRIPWPKQPILARAQDDSETAKPAFMVQGVLGTRVVSSSLPESKFPAWSGDLSTAYVDSASIVNLSPSPYSVLTPFETCANPHGLNGEEGDTFVAIRDPALGVDKFILLAVYPKHATLFFTFSADRPNGLYDVTCSVNVKSWRNSGGGPTSELKVYDTIGQAWGARTNDYGYAEWCTDKQRWVIIECQHYATRIRGKTNSDPGGSLPWPCNPSVGYNGRINVADTISVNIPAGWIHPGNDKSIWFEMDPVTGDWEAYQLEVDCANG